MKKPATQTLLWLCFTVHTLTALNFINSSFSAITWITTPNRCSECSLPSSEARFFFRDSLLVARGTYLEKKIWPDNFNFLTNPLGILIVLATTKQIPHGGSCDLFLALLSVSPVWYKIRCPKSILKLCPSRFLESISCRKGTNYLSVHKLVLSKACLNFGATYQTR